MLPWHVRFTVHGVPIESVDSVRYAAALSFARSVSTPERRFPQLERLQQQDVEIDGPALIQELDTLARLAPAEGLAAVLGNIRDDVLKGLAIAAGRG